MNWLTDENLILVFGFCAVFVVGFVAGITTAVMWKLEKYL